MILKSRLANHQMLSEQIQMKNIDAIGKTAVAVHSSAIDRTAFS